MITKMFEIRDAGTLIPVIATLMASPYEAEHFLIRRAGFNPESGHVFVGKIETCGGEYDPFKWPSSSRTMTIAHDYIQKNFNRLESGDVVDVEFIMGLRSTPKISERLT